MKILVIITFCLIAEIRSYAHEGRRQSWFLSVLGYVNTTAEEVEHFDRVLCEKNGGPEAYDDYVDEMNHYPICTHVVESEIIEEMSEGHSYMMLYDPDLYVRKVCAKMPKYLNCVKKFTNSAKTCIEASKHGTFDKLYNAVPAIAQFLCEDDALRIRTFMSSNGNEYLRSKNSELMNCAQNTLVSYVRETVSDGAEIGGIGICDFVVPDATKCTIFNNYQTCTVDVLKDSENQTAIADLAASMFEIVKNATTCDRLMQSATSLSTDIVDDV